MKSDSHCKMLLELFAVSLRLGLTSFGGPAAHIGYFRDEYVEKKKWLDEKEYADLVALCQFLPGPASSQVGMGIGIIRAGFTGGMVSFLGFTLPSAILLAFFAVFIGVINLENAGWLHGLKLVAAAVVLHAVIGMGKSFSSSKATASMTVAATVISLLWTSQISQIVIILLAAVFGLTFINQPSREHGSSMKLPVSRKIGLISLILFAVLLFFLPVIAEKTGFFYISMFDSFYRSGALVFGGGHVVLPLLEQETVPGLLDRETFLAGYGAAQAVPGPLFTFASYIGMAAAGWRGMMTSTLAIFLPAFLLIAGMLPFWNSIRQYSLAAKALTGVNAAVVGILLAALIDPIVMTTMTNKGDISFAAILYLLLAYWKAPPWGVVIIGITYGHLFF
ncbi:chromate efflux transporter [Bacillus massilinigeriensis]|uniref:chromate efflux transporter n=1 Tax=Bacillus mediterraneensis TaxID=1805474 RepID=UPI0008F8C382|nr:chromate efflux transporter [Bacillus mediterraneensis]